MTSTYFVPGISCEHCKTSIEGEVGRLDGVAVVEVDVEAQTVFVDGDVADDDVRAAIVEAGYDEVLPHDQAPLTEDGGEVVGVDDGEPLGGAGEGDVESA